MSAGPGLGVPLDAPSPWRGTCQGPGPPAVFAYAPQVFRALLPALWLEECGSSPWEDPEQERMLRRSRWARLLGRWGRRR